MVSILIPYRDVRPSHVLKELSGLRAERSRICRVILRPPLRQPRIIRLLQLLILSLLCQLLPLEMLIRQFLGCQFLSLRSRCRLADAIAGISITRVLLQVRSK